MDDVQGGRIEPEVPTSMDERGPTERAWFTVIHSGSEVAALAPAASVAIFEPAGSRMGVEMAPSGPTKGSTSEALMGALTHEGAQWRPFDSKGVLVKPNRAPRSAAAVFAACERTLLAHLKAVCIWPEKARDQTWRIGDYALYIIDFSPAPDTRLYLQFWSEPEEEGAIFEVSSGLWNPPADEHVDTEKQELLRDHGFEIGGNAND